MSDPINTYDPTGLRQAGNPLDNLYGGGYSGGKVSAYKPPSQFVASGGLNLGTLGSALGTSAYNAAPNLVSPGTRAALSAGVSLVGAGVTSTRGPTGAPSGGILSTIGNAAKAVGSFAYDTAKNYPSYVKTELNTAGRTIIQNGSDAGAFFGDHVSQLYYDPSTELDRVRQGRDNIARGVYYTGKYAYNNPIDAASGVFYGGINYVDQLTSSPEASGRFLGNGATNVATGAGTAVGKQIIWKGLTSVGQFASQIDVANTVHSLRVTNNPAHRVGGIRLTPPNNPLLRGDVGKFGDLERRAVVGDNLTPHHMPQAALGFTNRSGGGAIAIGQSEHVLTRTYLSGGAKLAVEEAGHAFRAVLSRDIRDLRNIAGRAYNESIQGLLGYYRQNYPELVAKPK